jgi:hypothetical protein
MNPAMNLALLRAPDLRAAEDVIQLALIPLEKFKGDVVWLRYEVARKE